ncbi:cryptochrome/photolyase family protein [Thioalkalivibrio sp. ALE17]|uniref:cryptochrome/photolyase family protein n=1 Tax=Thioalkalivibrio sp. ALE17 TaxID=1158173 RepID=UPI00041CDF32|nr:cryptochrome/photolyase family protein [Thioalkalivibrio sp. ALE17]
MATSAASVRTLLVVLGDQLAPDHPVLQELDPDRDAVWMAEVAHESRHVLSHAARTTLFLSAMRHFARQLRKAGLSVHYRHLGEHPEPTLGEALDTDLERLQPTRVIVLQPGEHRVCRQLEATCRTRGVPLEVREDPCFLVSQTTFEQWAGTRKQLRMEYFYRQQRAALGILMNGDEPAGGQWNFDADNRGHFGRDGPGLLPLPVAFEPDTITRECRDAVARYLPELAGQTDAFDWPVTPEQAQQALADFIQHRLPLFGTYQDAMWTDQPWLYHARLSAALNLHLIHPRAVIDAAEQAWRDGHAPLPAVEGFIRQILGWREYVRGLYFHFGEAWHEWNALEADQPLPALYWDAETSMQCLHQAVGQTLKRGYAHHIQRLMVTGLFAQLLGVRPAEIHAWYLGIYVDAVEWVELPNVVGMSQYADGGRMASKPYVATGRYIQRMSNYCRHCPFDPAEALGAKACPFTTLYWDFLDRHRERFARHPRTALQWKHLEKMDPERLEAIRAQARHIRDTLAQGDRI